MGFYPLVINAITQSRWDNPFSYRSISMSCRIGFLAGKFCIFEIFIPAKTMGGSCQIADINRDLFA